VIELYLARKCTPQKQAQYATRRFAERLIIMPVCTPDVCLHPTRLAFLASKDRELPIFECYPRCYILSRELICVPHPFALCSTRLSSDENRYMWLLHRPVLLHKMINARSLEDKASGTHFLPREDEQGCRRSCYIRFRDVRDTADRLGHDSD